MWLSGVGLAEVGAAAFAAGVEIHELSRPEIGLERTFLELTEGVAGPPGAPPAARREVTR